MKKDIKKEKGFTLVESLVAIAVFALAMGATVAFILISYRTYGYTWQQSIAVNEARRGIETMVKEIREARTGDDGSYPIALAQDKEFIFYSDINGDGKTERVRYFLGTTNSGNQTKECVTFSDGGSCSVSFDDFLSGTLESAELEVSLEGDFGWFWEFAEIYVDGVDLGERVCRIGCHDCLGAWEGNTVFDVTSQAEDGNLHVLADANSNVNNICNWIEPNHSMKARFKLSWTEELVEGDTIFKKGVISPVGDPAQYPEDQEEVTILSSYVRNSPPIFKYYDKEGNRIEEYPSRLIDTKLMKLFLVINIDPHRAPSDFELESSVQLRNLKEE